MSHVVLSQDLVRLASEDVTRIVEILNGQLAPLAELEEVPHEEERFRRLGYHAYVLETHAVHLMVAVGLDADSNVSAKLLFSLNGKRPPLGEPDFWMFELFRRARSRNRVIHFRLADSKALSPILLDFAQRFRLLEEQGPRSPTDEKKRAHRMLKFSVFKAIIAEIGYMTRHAMGPSKRMSSGT